MLITVSRATPGASVQIEAVRAALLDGRIDMKPWALGAGVAESTARAWLADEPVQESYEARLWAAAVTTTIPGWTMPRNALQATIFPARSPT